MHPIRPFATPAFRIVERQRHGPYRQRSSLLSWAARTAGMIPVANVEAKVRHAAVLVAPQQYDAENSRLFVRLPELGRDAPRISKRSYVVKAALG